MNSILEPNKNYPFDKIKLNNPKPMQGGSFFCELEVDQNEIYIQLPKVLTKKGFCKSGKKEYIDLLFSSNNIDFVKWYQSLEDRIRNILLEKGEEWFDQELSMDDIEYNWQDGMKTYKKNYLLRAFVPKNKYNEAIKIWDDENKECELNDITETSKIICIIQFSGIKISQSTFTMDANIRQIMLFKQTPFMNKCLINVKNSDKEEEREGEVKDIDENTNEENTNDENTNDENTNEEKKSTTTKDNNEKIQTKNKIKLTKKSDVKDNALEKPTISSDVEDDETQNTNSEDIEKPDLQKSNTIEKNMNIEKTIENLEENNLEQSNNSDDLENKNTNLSDLVNFNKVEEELKNDVKVEPEFSINDTLDEVNLEISNLKEEESNQVKLELKNRQEIFLKMYNTALEKARKSKKEAIKQYLEAKKIKKLYMLDEIEDSSDEELEYLSD